MFPFSNIGPLSSKFPCCTPLLVFVLHFAVVAVYQFYVCNSGPGKGSDFGPEAQKVGDPCPRRQSSNMLLLLYVVHLVVLKSTFYEKQKHYFLLLKAIRLLGLEPICFCHLSVDLHIVFLCSGANYVVCCSHSLILGKVH